jgi:hypothetical protein
MEVAAAALLVRLVPPETLEPLCAEGVCVRGGAGKAKEPGLRGTSPRESWVRSALRRAWPGARPKCPIWRAAAPELRTVYATITKADQTLESGGCERD